MLNIEACKEYFEEVREFAEKTGQTKQLDLCLENLQRPEDQDVEVELYKDFAPLSFQFRKTITDRETGRSHSYVGGVIFHGNHDGFGSGSAPTFSVCLEATNGWSIHT